MYLTDGFSRLISPSEFPRACTEIGLTPTLKCNINFQQQANWCYLCLALKWNVLTRQHNCRFWYNKTADLLMAMDDGWCDTCRSLEWIFHELANWHTAEATRFLRMQTALRFRQLLNKDRPSVPSLAGPSRTHGLHYTTQPPQSDSTITNN